MHMSKISSYRGAEYDTNCIQKPRALCEDTAADKGTSAFTWTPPAFIHMATRDHNSLTEYYCTRRRKKALKCPEEQ